MKVLLAMTHVVLDWFRWVRYASAVLGKIDHANLVTINKCLLQVVVRVVDAVSLILKNSKFLEKE